MNNTAIVTRFHYIEYKIAKNGTISPIIHFKEVKYKGSTIRSLKTDWSTLEALNLSPLCNLHIYEVIPSVISIAGTSKHNDDPIQLPQLCPCCKQPLAIGNNTRKCNNAQCPEKTGSFDHLLADHKLLDSPFGSLALIRYAGINTKAVIARRKSGAHDPVILYQSLNQIADIMFTLGYTGKFA